METIKIPCGMYDKTIHGLTDQELKVILPLVKSEHNRAVKMVEYYEDLTIDGYGTERQTTALVKWQDKANILAHIINYAKSTKL